MKLTVTGADALQAKLTKLAASETDIETATVQAGATVAATAMRQVSPQGVANRITAAVSHDGDSARSHVMLRRLPGRRGPRRDPSYYKNPKTYLSAALRTSRSRAVVAMKRAAKQRVASIAGTEK